MKQEGAPGVDSSGLRPKMVCKMLSVMFMTQDFPTSKALTRVENYHSTFPWPQGDTSDHRPRRCARWRVPACGTDDAGGNGADWRPAAPRPLVLRAERCRLCSQASPGVGGTGWASIARQQRRMELLRCKEDPREPQRWRLGDACKDSGQRVSLEQPTGFCISLELMLSHRLN